MKLPVSHFRNTVSVVVPCFNARDWLQSCVSSCLGADEPIVEVIVVDDGSTDGSIDSIDGLRKRHPDRLRCIRQENRGAPAARALGQSLATGVWLYFLDADDLLIPGVLNKMLGAGSSSDVIFGDATMINAKGEPIGVRDQRPKVDSPVAGILFGAPLNGTALIRRSRTGPYWDDRFQAVDEFFYFASLAANGRSFLHVPGPVAAYRQHDAPSRLSNRSFDYGAALARAFLALAPALREAAMEDLELSAYLRWIFLDLASRRGNGNMRNELLEQVAALRAGRFRKLTFAARRYGIRRLMRMLLTTWMRR